VVHKRILDRWSSLFQLVQLVFELVFQLFVQLLVG